MLPSLGFQEIVVLAILALVVVGPKDLPRMLRELGRWTAKMRAMAQEFRSGFDELARQAELDELRKEVDALRHSTQLSDIQHELTKPIPLPSIEPPAAPVIEEAAPPSSPVAESEPAPRASGTAP